MASVEDANNARKAYGRRSCDTSKETESSKGTTSGSTPTDVSSSLTHTRGQCPRTPPRNTGSGSGAVAPTSRRSHHEHSRHGLPQEDHNQMTSNACQGVHQSPILPHRPCNQGTDASRGQLYSRDPRPRPVNRIASDTGIDTSRPGISDAIARAQIIPTKVAVHCSQDLAITNPTSHGCQIPPEGCRVRFRDERDDPRYPDMEIYKRGNRGNNEYTCLVKTPAYYEPGRIVVTLFTWPAYGQDARMISEGYYDVVSGNQVAPVLGVVPSVAGSSICPCCDMHLSLNTQTGMSHAIQPSSNGASPASTGRTVVLCREDDEDNIRLFICFFNYVTGKRLPETLSLNELKEQFPDAVIDPGDKHEAQPYIRRLCTLLNCEVVRCRSEIEENGCETQTTGLYLPSSLSGAMSSETGKNLLLAHKHKALTGNKVVEIARDYVYLPKEAVNIVKLDPSKSTKQGSRNPRPTKKTARENTEKRFLQERKSISTEDSKSRGPPPIPTRYKVVVNNGRNSEDPGSLTDQSVLISDAVSASTVCSTTSRSSSNSEQRPPQPPPKGTRPPWPKENTKQQKMKELKCRTGGGPKSDSDGSEVRQMKHQTSSTSVTSSSSSNSSSNGSNDSGCDSSQMEECGALPSTEDQEGVGQTSQQVEVPARSSEEPACPVMPSAAKTCAVKPPGKLWVPLLPFAPVVKSKPSS